MYSCMNTVCFYHTAPPPLQATLFFKRKNLIQESKADVARFKALVWENSSITRKLGCDIMQTKIHIQIKFPLAALPTESKVCFILYKIFCALLLKKFCHNLKREGTKQQEEPRPVLSQQLMLHYGQTAPHQ